jgi:hypothetical protein
VTMGGWRRSEPRSKTSMIMRPPQHGRIALLGSTAALAGSPLELGTASSARVRCVGARAVGEQAVVADAVQAFGQHVDEEAADEPWWAATAGSASSRRHPHGRAPRYNAPWFRQRLRDHWGQGVRLAFGIAGSRPQPRATAASALPDPGPNTAIQPLQCPLFHEGLPHFRLLRVQPGLTLNSLLGGRPCNTLMPASTMSALGTACKRPIASPTRGGAPYSQPRPSLGGQLPWTLKTLR